MTAQMPLAAEDVIGGNFYPKYTTRNPVAQLLVRNFVSALHRLARRTGASEIHEIGCGEGFLSTSLAQQGYRTRGCDLSAAAIACAKARAAELALQVPFRTADLYALTPELDGAELVVCCEVLEHLPDPERALGILASLARPHLIVSVPREPLWRLLNMARGRYWRDFGNTPGHLQHWSARGLGRLAGRHVDVVDCLTPLPWTMLLCRAR